MANDYRIGVPLEDADRVRLEAFRDAVRSTSPARIAPSLPALASVVMRLGLDAIDAQDKERSKRRRARAA